ncbi:helix-turn-helix domain-containing protein [Lentibacillus cibarius]|uniref:Helix-turn-helix transcriptional regulator n=1 Tax=Lentibacillus cibarius TaxID=2583219 RepID=A0A5S3QIX1_9BACI|nr:helix-turn-helix domain-containing protein [Lentibacillus cibarius]TMN21872.1 helix-turn-helix transcriptional regulator [Lentibacillus cibarius]
MQPKKLKRAVIKEELVTLTGNMVQAVLLNQFIYWVDRMKDVDQYIKEEKNRSNDIGEEVNFPLSYGWIFKKAEDLVEETMIGITANTIRKHLNTLVDKGYIDKRNNPRYKWDKTFQYRVNMMRVMTDLQQLGFSLEGYELFIRNSNFNASEGKSNDSSQTKDGTNHTECGAIPETTSEITSEITTETSSSVKADEDELNNQNLNYINQPFEQISQMYLSLSQRNWLTANDKVAIDDVIKQNWSTDQVVRWMKECFQQFKASHKRDQIRSFQYVANYIFDQAHQSNLKGDISNGQHSRHNQENQENAGSEYFRRYERSTTAEDEDWENNIDF